MEIRKLKITWSWWEFKMKKKLRKNWWLGFLGFLALLGIPGILTQDWLDMIWLVWVVWLIYFIPLKSKK